MNNYLDLNIKEINKLLKEKKILPIDLVNEAIDRIEKNSDLNCFITLNKEEALKCAKELEKIGYNCLLIANSDELLLHPRDLVELVVKTRKILNPNTVLIFTFAEPSFMPLLSYMGIDGFLKDSANYYSYLNDFMTPTKTYDLDEYFLFDEISREQLEENNLKTLEFVIREIQTHIKNNSLRNLVEERSLTTPQNVSALKILDKKYMSYLLENTQLY